VQRAANTILVNAQLIDARNDWHLVRKPTIATSPNVFAIQSEIAKAMPTSCRRNSRLTRRTPSSRPPTTDLAAFDLYRRAKSLLLTAGFARRASPDVRRQSSSDEAVTRDPSFFRRLLPARLCPANNFMATIGSYHTPARLPWLKPRCKPRTRCARMPPKRNLAPRTISLLRARD